jgi:Ca2+-binding EF-hand superfamily protein
MLRGFDANKDGVIDPREVPEDRRRFLGFIGSRMGVDFSKPVAIDKLREKATQQFGGDAKNKEPEPLVPGFGVEREEVVVLAFGEREPETTSYSSSSSSSRGGGSSRSSGEQNSRAEGFANMMMRRYDRDGDGVLRRDKGEWNDLRGDPNETDRNRDGKIDRNEMIARVSAYMGGNRGGEGDSREEENRDSKNDGRKSYRALTAAERLPEGLPDWFEDRDDNSDGQVTMAEYSSYWDDGKAREYLRYDLNDDGVVTPDECLLAMSRPDFEAPAFEGASSPTDEGTSTGESKPEATEEKKDSGGAKPWWME